MGRHVSWFGTMTDLYTPRGLKSTIPTLFRIRSRPLGCSARLVISDFLMVAADISLTRGLGANRQVADCCARSLLFSTLVTPRGRDTFTSKSESRIPTFSATQLLISHLSLSRYLIFTYSSLKHRPLHAVTLRFPYDRLENVSWKLQGSRRRIQFRYDCLPVP